MNIKEFVSINEVELKEKLGIENEEFIMLDEDWGCFGEEDDDERGIDVSLVKEKIVEDIYNERNEIEIGGKIIYYNDYR